MAPITTVAVVGGSGGVGEGVLPQLLKTNLQITAVSRAESKAKYPSVAPTAALRAPLTVPQRRRARSRRLARRPGVVRARVPRPGRRRQPSGRAGPDQRGRHR